MQIADIFAGQRREPRSDRADLAATAQHNSSSCSWCIHGLFLWRSSRIAVDCWVGTGPGAICQWSISALHSEPFSDYTACISDQGILPIKCRRSSLRGQPLAFPARLRKLFSSYWYWCPIDGSLRSIWRHYCVHCGPQPQLRNHWPGSCNVGDEFSQKGEETVALNGHPSYYDSYMYNVQMLWFFPNILPYRYCRS